MNEKFLIPFSILIAGLLIGTALYFTTTKEPPLEKKNDESIINVPKVDVEKDYIYGNKDADIFLIEYSDLECPFCKKFYNEVFQKLKVKEEYKEKLAFVFRSFPLTSIHPSSFEEAAALECSGELGGDDTYFKYKGKIFSETQSDGKFDSKRLPKIASELDLNEDDFKKCLEKPETISKIQKAYDEAVDIGIRSTPAIFLQLKSGEEFSVPADFKVIDTIINSYLYPNKE